jgi:outer membrane protein assembly factor BamB
MRNGLPSLRTLSFALLAALAAAAFSAAPARAEHTRHWRQSNYEEFEKGTAKGVALRSDGTLVLAPRFAPFADPNAAYLWALRADSKGNLYAAGGSNAKVLRFDAKGTATTVFESAELAAQALAIDAQDNLYIGTSPDGKIYKVTPGGEKKVFFEPKTKYIWNLAFDRDGTLYVATGDKGEIFAVKPDGKGQVFYTSEETHIRALAFDANGNLLAGTEPNGLILRISKASGKDAAPHAFVLYEASKKEITALLVDRAGNIYAAAIGEKQRVIPLILPQAPAVQPQPTPPVGIQVTQPGVTMPAVQQPAQFVPFPPNVSGAVYRIAPDGAPEEVWSARDELVYALAFSAQGKLLLGTGNRGQVIQLEGNNVFSSLPKTAAAQVTSLAQGPGGKVYLCTANPGKVFTLGPDSEPEGSFESQTFDARIFSHWGRMEWWGESGGASGQPEIAFYVRSGNTSNPEKNWSPWAGPYTKGAGEKVEAPPARFVQWKAVFRSAGAREAGASPSISWVSLSYLPKNVAPTVDAIVVQNPGIRLQSFAAPSSGPTPQPVQLRLPPAIPGLASAFPSQPERAPRSEPPPQGLAQKGHQAVLWSARDENEDELVYAIYYRGEGEKTWKLLKDKVEHKFYSWDTASMPDGAYYLKIVASDAPSNPPDDALAAERESDRFEVDNTPPVIEKLSAQPTSPEVRVRFEARDSSSAIARAEYSLDGGEWTILFPVGRLADAPQESYELVLKGLPPGEHTVAVRVFDAFENTTSAKTTFTVR